MSLSALSTSRPVTVLMFSIGVVVLGVIAFFNLSVDFLPPIKIPKLTVRTSYPNTSPEEVERRVSEPMMAIAVAERRGAEPTQRAARTSHDPLFAQPFTPPAALLELRETPRAD